MSAVPKPAKPTRGTKACRDHMADVATLPCVCGCGRQPVQVHHVIMGRYARRRASDFDTIPLHPDCHRRLHASPKAWAEAHGQDVDFVPWTQAEVAKLRSRTIGGRR